METRLKKRRETLETQFAVMEELVSVTDRPYGASTLNSQSDYITSFFESYNQSS